MIVTQQAAVHLGDDWFGYFTFNQKSATKNSETLVRCNDQFGQRTKRNSRDIPYRLSSQFLEKGRLCWLTKAVQLSTAKSLCVLRFSVVHGKNQWKSRKAHGRRNSIGLWIHPNVENFWSNRRGADGVRVEKFPRIHSQWKILAEIQNMMNWTTLWTWAIPRTNYLHVNKQRQCMKRKRKRRILYCELKIAADYAKNRARTLVVSWAWIRERNGYGTRTCTNRMENGIESLRTWCSASVKADTPCYVDPVLWNEEIWMKSKGEGKLSFISVATTTPLNWFFARSSPSISSVSTEQ